MFNQRYPKASLPIELITEILLRLPAKPLIRFKLLSKQYKALINSQDFIDLHFDRSLAVGQNLHFLIKTPKLHLCDYDTFANRKQLSYPKKYRSCSGGEIVDTCNGIVCLWNRSSWYIYNPTTQTYKDVPRLDISDPFENGEEISSYCGFGYDDVGRDYKCVSIYLNYHWKSGVFESEVMVYSLREDRWRRGEGVPHYFCSRKNRRGVFLNGVLHWLGNIEVEGYRRVYTIVCFDLREERFSSIELPEILKGVVGWLYVGVMGGQLCLVVNHMHYYEFLVMEEYGVVESWKRVYRVQQPNFYECTRIIGHSRSGKELFVTLFVEVAKIDLESLEISVINVPRLSDIAVDAVLCVENLMMLGD